jgi:cytochrome c5
MKNTIALPLLLLAAALLPAPALAASERSGEEIVQYQCILCHGPGIGGAPKIGDRKAWGARAQSGLDGLVRSATQGRGAMPPSGGLAELKESELRAAIAYMLQKSGAARD